MKFASLIVAIAFAGVAAHASDVAPATTTTAPAAAATETKTVEKKANHKKGGAKAHAEAAKAAAPVAPVAPAAPAAPAPAGH